MGRCKAPRRGEGPGQCAVPFSNLLYLQQRGSLWPDCGINHNVSGGALPGAHNTIRALLNHELKALRLPASLCHISARCHWLNGYRKGSMAVSGFNMILGFHL